MRGHRRASDAGRRWGRPWCVAGTRCGRGPTSAVRVARGRRGAFGSASLERTVVLPAEGDAVLGVSSICPLSAAGEFRTFDGGVCADSLRTGQVQRSSPGPSYRTVAAEACSRLSCEPPPHLGCGQPLREGCPRHQHAPQTAWPGHHQQAARMTGRRRMLRSDQIGAQRSRVRRRAPLRCARHLPRGGGRGPKRACRFQCAGNLS